MHHLLEERPQRHLETDAGQQRGRAGPGTHDGGVGVQRRVPSARATTAPADVVRTDVTSAPNSSAPPSCCEQPDVAGDGVRREQRPGLGEPQRVALVGPQPGEEARPTEPAGTSVCSTPSAADRVGDLRQRAAGASRQTSPVLVCSDRPSRASSLSQRRERRGARAGSPPVGVGDPPQPGGPARGRPRVPGPVAVDARDLGARGRRARRRRAAPTRRLRRPPTRMRATVSRRYAECRQQIVDNPASAP